ncbi:hypothetical protein QYQ98_06480 [Corynebacterium sp. P3-F1]|uniref:hypothetical protein n=1 Tax=Corynebacterium sp. P3-F1 TaxID=3059080 RepID=UPI00265CE4BB|nr:hypothetical protein [Corynebacterium sp. P3-F1]WKK60695.1 hypothetical protein QYQ98_06480 [Corynebacterium sp. P3-F1]
MEIIAKIGKFAIEIAKAEGETGSSAYDLAYVFVGPWVSIADGASQLLGLIA